MSKKRPRKKRGGKKGRRRDRHEMTIDNLFSNGEMGTWQDVPHNVLMSHALDYIPTDPDSTCKLIPWDKVPKEAMDELYGNMPAISEMIRGKVIRPKEGLLSEEEKKEFREKEWISSSHGISDDRHFTVPIEVKGTFVSQRKDMATVEDVRLIEASGKFFVVTEMFCEHLATDPMVHLERYQREFIRKHVASYSALESYLNRQQSRLNCYWKGKDLSELSSSIEECIGIVEYERIPKMLRNSITPVDGDGKIHPRDGGGHRNEIVAGSHDLPLFVSMTFRMDPFGRYWVTMRLLCDVTFTAYEVTSVCPGDGKITRKYIDTRITQTKINGKDSIAHMYHVCACSYS
jgi:hypothetical protein